MPGPSPEQLARYAEKFNHSQALRGFGFQVSFPTMDKVVVRVDPVRPDHRGGLGTQAVHGGVLAAVFDLVIGCTPALIDPTRRTATVQLSMSFERPVHGEAIWAEGQIDTVGQTTLFSSARIFDAEGNACARCLGVVRLSKIKWASGDSPAVN
jgi:uncharacterized protein (TIGR00369 family)